MQPIGNIEDWFRALSLKDSGVLYEDPYIQIGIKSDWREAQGKVVLFLGNKHTASLVNVRVLILPAPHLKMQFSQVPDTIPPRAQVGLYSSLKIATGQFFSCSESLVALGCGAVCKL
jgi:AP-2 complex subunit alpha